MVSRSRERHFPHTHRRGKKWSLHARHFETTTFGMAAGSSGIVKYPSFMGTRGRGASLIGGETLHAVPTKSSQEKPVSRVDRGVSARAARGRAKRAGEWSAIRLRRWRGEGT